MSETPNPSGFTYSPFSCFGDISVCLITMICPCYQVAKNKAMVDNRECTICDFCCAQQNLEFFTRQQIRARFNLPYEVAMDCIMMCVLGQCLVCQDARELKLRNAGAK